MLNVTQSLLSRRGVGCPATGIVQRMDRLKAKWLVRITAYGAAIVVGLSVALAVAFALDVWSPEPSGAVVLLVLAAAAVVAVYLGRATYRGVCDLLSDTPNP